MLDKIKKKREAIVKSDKDVPLLAGFIIGLYPLLFFYSNNYPFVNHWQHFLVYTAIYIVLPCCITVISYFIFNRIPPLKPYKKHLLFVLLIFLTSVFMCQVLYFTFKKKILLGILILSCLLSIKLYHQYKRIIFIIVILMLFPMFKCFIHIYEHIRPSQWTKIEDTIVKAKFIIKPNVYMIQPDGYVSRKVLEAEPYSYKTDFYDWLAVNDFTVYNNFNSNYPASITSNASMFAMKHHYFDDVLFPDIEMPKGRKTIMDNNAVAIFKNNGYETFYIAQEEYFQQNKIEGNYDHYNIKTSEIPLFTRGGKLVKNVNKDLEDGMAFVSEKPKFFFVEKVLPHHIHFDAPQANRIKTERQLYINKLEEANAWLKKTVAMINAKDSNAVIIILADHGGWVGMQDFNEFYKTNDRSLINSTFGNLAAIQWKGINHLPYDAKLKSNVNVFRVLFACLSENKSYLDHMEGDASFNLRPDNFFSKTVYKLIDQEGKVVNKKHE